MSKRSVTDKPLQEARDAFEHHAWREAFDLLTAADASGGLAPEDLEKLAEASWWTGRMDDCIQARERAYAAYVEAGNGRRAARVALKLSRNYQNKLAPSVAGGWLNSAQRLLGEEPECPEHGYLSLTLAFVSWTLGNLDNALDYAKRTFKVGSRFGDRDLQALGLSFQGGILVAKGQVSEGLALLDEAMVGAVGGEHPRRHRQHLLQHDLYLRAARRLPPRRRVDRVRQSLVRPPVHHRLPGPVPGASGPHHAFAGGLGRGGAGCPARLRRAGALYPHLRRRCVL